MAEYGIAIGIKDIKGSCALADYKDYLLGSVVSFGSTSSRSKKKGKEKRVSIRQTNVAVSILSGKWTAELQEAFFVNKDLGQVVLVQLAQAVDKNATAKPTVLQKVTLEHATIASMNQAWTQMDGPRTVDLTIEFDKFLLEVDGGALADFTLRNFTTGAI